jgi:Leucine-rich repeat (LRR) protein
LLVSCGKEDNQPETPIGLGKSSGQVFYASTESHKQPDTKVYADENMQVLWNENDHISIFNKTTFNSEYLFTGEDGDNYGSFEEIPASGFVSGNTLSKVYAVYPYYNNNKINNAGTAITMTLPSEQTYKAHSFGIGANAMIAVTENNFLAFKNVCGYLSLRFYGDNVSVSCITLRGNNGEKIAGKASIAVSTTTPPVTTMDNTATDAITLVCDPPVQLGSTASEYTDFWFAIPPTTFSGGFTITVTDALGGTYEKSTTRSFTVTRNQMDWMNPLKVEITYDEENTFVPFEDANFKAYCVNNFDTNNDGEISLAEAKLVTRISVITDENHDNISSLRGIEFFVNLTSLQCTGSGSSGTNLGKLTFLDVSHNTALTEFRCYNNRLTSLDVSHNTALRVLVCYHNLLNSLDVSHNTALEYLHCSSNQLTSLDVSHNTALTSLSCGFNQLTSLDVSHNTALTSLSCQSNQLTSLDVSHNTTLTSLNCNSNQLTSLDVSHNTALSLLYCSSNQLTSLDVMQNTALTQLYCYSNQLTSLDVSHNTALTSLSCESNQLTSLDVSNNTALKYLNCENNQLTSLDISQNTDLISLYCYSNQLTSLDVSHNTALKSLYCDSNQLTSLDVMQNTALTQLYCYSNQLTSLNVSYNTVLNELRAWPQSGNLGTLYKVSTQTINYKNNAGSIISPSDYGTTIVEVD